MVKMKRLLGMSHSKSLQVVVLTILWALGVTVSAYAQQSSAEILKIFGRDHGLCVIIGCGDERLPALAADLASSGKMLVHGIALDEASLTRAQKAIAAAGVDGLATVEKLPVNPLPYRDNLVNLVVVTNSEDASAAGLSKKEALRCIAPNGKLCVYKDGKWDVSVKPMPKEMDEWTHEAHGPDGNCVSKDTVVHFPVGFRWHAGLPMNLCNRKQPANAWSSIRGIALVGGRCFTLSTSVLENLGPTYSSEHGVDQYVTARDAFNGLFLWRKRIGPTFYGGLIYPNRAPFAAVGDLVYVASEDGKLLALNASNGEIAKTFDTTCPPGRILIDDNVVAVATWKNGTRVGGTHGVDRRRMDFAIADGTVEAFDVESSKRLWKIEKLATSIRSADGILFMVQRKGADKREEIQRRRGKNAPPLPPRPEQSVIAVALRTGEQLWEVTSDAFGPNEYLRIDAAGLGVVAVSRDNGVKTSVLSAKDGKLLFKANANSYAAFHDGAIHLGGKRYDPATGKEVGPSSIRLGRTICTPHYFVNNIIVNNRGGAFIVDGKTTLYGGARGGCLFASVPAYGMFHTPSNWCACAPAQIPGCVAFGPIAHEPSTDEMEAAPIVEKGPALKITIENQKLKVENTSDWPMYRNNPYRSNATSSPAPQELDVLWRKTLTTPPPEGLVASDWREYLNSSLTAPVIAEGIVAAAAMDRGQVIALDAASGKELWRYTVGGRVDTPPTIHRGACLFGSHDGYVYALSSKEGRLAWKMRVAPREERMVSYGKIESPWPVVGTILVAGGVGYASAGRTQGSDGGIVVRAFDPASGKIAWSKAIPPNQNGGGYREMRRNDLMLKVGDAIQLMLTRMDPMTGDLRRNVTHEYQKHLARQRRLKALKQQPKKEEQMTIDEVAPSIGLEGFISWNWTRLGNRKYRSMNFGDISGYMLSWDERIICANIKAGRATRAVSREQARPVGAKFDNKGIKWESNLPAGYQATAVVVCKNSVVIGGGIYSKEAKEGQGFIQTLSLDTGAKIAERTFNAPLTYNGVAVAGGKIYATLADGAAVCMGGK